MKIAKTLFTLAAASFILQSKTLAGQVVNTSDDGPGSLRQAIASAQPGETITFASSLSGQTIHLTSAQLVLGKSLNIAGPGADQLIIERNTADGVFRIFEINSGAAVGISGLTLRNGADEGAGGGAIFVDQNCALTLENSALTANQAYAAGAVLNRGTLSMTGCTLWGNTASDSGAILNEGTATILNSTISGNTAISAGAIRNNGTMILTHATVVNNHTWGETGDFGIINFSDFTLRDSILGNNSRRNLSSFGPINVVGVNLSSDETGRGTTTVPWTGPGGLNLGPLRNNGGPTPTHALLPDSVAIDAAVDSADMKMDQRGVSRPKGARADVGAFEFSPDSAPSVTCGEPSSYCASSSGVIVAEQVSVTDLDEGQTLTIKLMNLGAVVDTQTIKTPANNALVTFREVRVLPGVHQLDVLVSDGDESSSCSTTISVNLDSQAPIAVSVPADQIVAHPNPAAFGAPQFRDNCDAPLTVEYADAFLPAGGKEIVKTKRTWTAIDAAGNSTQASQTITIVDITAPTFTRVPANLTAAATSPAGAAVAYSPATATDNRNGITVTYSKASGSVFPVGVTTVQITATDAVGNQSSASFTVTVTAAPTAPVANAKIQLDALITTVNGLTLNKLDRAALLLALDVAKVSLQKDKKALAIDALKVFEFAVDALSRARKLPTDPAARLISASKNVRSAIAS